MERCKIEPSFLIHAETFKGENSAIGKPSRVFSELRIRLARVWRPPTAILYLNKEARVFLACVKHTHGQHLRTQVCICAHMKEGRVEFLFLFEV